MADAGANHLAVAEQHWNRFEGSVQEHLDEYLNAGAFDPKSFNRYIHKLSKRVGTHLNDTEIETTRRVLTENMKKEVMENLRESAQDNELVEKFAGLCALTEKAPPEDSYCAVRNMQNPRMDMELFKFEEMENFAKHMEDIAAMYEDINKDTEESLVLEVEEMTDMRDWIVNEIDRKREEKRTAHSEGNVRRAAPRRRSSIGTLNTTTTVSSRRSIDPEH